MSYCHVSNQIAIHCDEEEAYCSCGSTMTFGDTAKTASILFCDDIDCGKQVDTEEEL